MKPDTAPRLGHRACDFDRVPSYSGTAMDIKTVIGKSALPHIQNIVPYPPGKPLEELEREWGITGAIKLASNENPLGPSPKAVKAMQDALAAMHRYPDGSGYYLRHRLSEKTGIPFECLMVGNGSNDIIDMAVRTFMTMKDEAVSPFPTFLMYEKFVQMVGGRMVNVPLKNLAVDLTAVAEAFTPRTKIVFLNNPNNPTGTWFSIGEFTRFMENVPAGVVVVLDEAYMDFAREKDIPRGEAYREAYPNLVVLRTFSKAYGLAGVRIGYGFAHPEVVSLMTRARQPFATNAVALAGALAALEDDDFLRRTQSVVWEGLSFFLDRLESMGLSCVPTQTNFFLVNVGKAGEVYQSMLREGVIIRSMESYGLPEYIRISVGLPEENERCVRALSKVLGK